MVTTNSIKENLRANFEAFLVDPSPGKFAILQSRMQEWAGTTELITFDPDGPSWPRFLCLNCSKMVEHAPIMKGSKALWECQLCDHQTERKEATS